MDFAIPADYREKLKENEIIDKFMDVARKQKNADSYTNVISALGTVPKDWNNDRRNWKSEE